MKQTQATIDIQSDTLILRKHDLTVPLVAYQAIKSDTRSSKPRCARQQIQTHAVIAPIMMGEKWEPEPPLKTEQLSSVDDMRKELEEMGVNFQNTPLIGQDLDRLATFVFTNKDIIATKYKDIVGSPVLQYQVDLEDSQPFQQRSYRFSRAEFDIINEYVSQLLDANIIERSMSLYRSPLFLIDKKAEFGKQPKKRVLLDARRLNQATKPLSYRMENLSQVLDSLTQARPT